MSDDIVRMSVAQFSRYIGLPQGCAPDMIRVSLDGTHVEMRIPSLSEGARDKVFLSPPQHCDEALIDYSREKIGGVIVVNQGEI